MDDRYTEEVARGLLQEFTVKELRQTCKLLNIKYAGLTKASMVEAVLKADNAVVRATEEDTP